MRCEFASVLLTTNALACVRSNAQDAIMPLKLSLKPGEKFVLNGAVLTNGDKRTSLVIQNKAALLRERDIMQPEDADTPARRIYFPIMMMYLEPQGVEDAYTDFAL